MATEVPLDAVGENPPSTTPTFTDLGLPDALCATLTAGGYTQPTPIQAQTVPALLAGRDVVGQAQTGTGKTAAFTLPVLARLAKNDDRSPQVLVLAPTRELALQVSQAVSRYGADMPDLRVSTIYGGAPYDAQLKQLRRGVDIVVGTPGRIMDHMRSGALKLGQLRTLVLDEADEMLRMGFLDDVTWILEHTPAEHQMALFSATMPDAVREVANRYLNEPEHVQVKAQTQTAATIEQYYCSVRNDRERLVTLCRVLSTEPADGVMVFVRTKQATVNIVAELEQHGFACAALNGDMPQALREQTVARLKAHQLDIVVATDVAARGLDVGRVSHVVNFHMPHDSEAYIHRIGRTGRAGRDGTAIMFVHPRDRRSLQLIERNANCTIKPFSFQSLDSANERRVQLFKDRVREAAAADTLDPRFGEVVAALAQESELTVEQIAAGLAQLASGAQGLWLKESPQWQAQDQDRAAGAFDSYPSRGPRRDRGPRRGGPRSGGSGYRDRDRSKGPNRRERSDRHFGSGRPPRPDARRSSPNRPGQAAKRHGPDAESSPQRERPDQAERSDWQRRSEQRPGRRNDGDVAEHKPQAERTEWQRRSEQRPGRRERDQRSPRREHAGRPEGRGPTERSTRFRSNAGGRPSTGERGRPPWQRGGSEAPRRGGPGGGGAGHPRSRFGRPEGRDGGDGGHRSGARFGRPEGRDSRDRHKQGSRFGRPSGGRDSRDHKPSSRFGRPDRGRDSRGHRNGRPGSGPGGSRPPQGPRGSSGRPSGPHGGGSNRPPFGKRPAPGPYGAHGKGNGGQTGQGRPGKPTRTWRKEAAGFSPPRRRTA